jgi:hypothetical protein
MYRKAGSVLFTAIIIFYLSACSSSNHDPVNPEISLHADLSAPTTADNHYPIGFGEIYFDVENMKVSVTGSRNPAVHLDVAHLIPNPIITINSFDPRTNVIDIDVTLQNVSQVDAYDVRLIIFTDNMGHMLMNPDNWTSLYDIPGGYNINPFKAYAKDSSRHKFQSQTQYTENLRIYLPRKNTNVKFAVDASISSNCEEPFSIQDFTQEAMYADSIRTATLTVNVLDWQSDVSEVNLVCSDITGVHLFPFSQVGQVQWQVELLNSNNAPAGEYPAIIEAKSSNSGNLPLYDVVTIVITSGIPPPDQPEVVGFFGGLRSPTRTFIKNGNLAYVGEEEPLSYACLKVVDISDPDHPVTIHCQECEASRDFVIMGNYLYHTEGQHGLVVYDISDPAKPEYVCYKAVGGEAWAVEAKDNYAYVSYSYPYNIAVIDISNPSNPQKVATIEAAANDLFIRDNLLFSVINSGYLEINDITDPLNPQQVCQIWDRNGYIDIENNIVFTSGSANAVHSYDIRDPSNPVLLDQYWKNNIWAIDVAGDYAFVAVGETGLLVLDVSNPSDMQEVTLFEMDDAYRVRIHDNNAYVTAWESGLKIIDVSDSMNPFQRSELPVFTPTASAIDGDVFYIIGLQSGFTSVDMTNREHPGFLDSFPIFTPYCIDMNGNYCWVTTAADLYLIDIQNPSDCRIVRNWSTDEDLRSLFVEDNYQYLIDSVSFMIFDISDPVNPSYVSEILYPDPRAIQVSGDYAYVVDTEIGLIIIDISSKENPVEVSRLECDQGCFRNVKIEGNRAFLVGEINNSDKLISVNIADKTTPLFESSLFVDVDINDFYVQGNYAYVACGKYVEIVNLSNPSNMTIIADLLVRDKPPSDWFMGFTLALQDNYLYALSQYEGVYIVKLWE